MRDCRASVAVIAIALHTSRIERCFTGKGKGKGFGDSGGKGKGLRGKRSAATPGLKVGRVSESRR